VQSGPIFQLSYVTRNIDRARAMLRAQADIRAEFYADVETEVQTPAGPASLQMKLAFMWISDAFHYELIQPVSGLEHIYAAALPDDDSLRFHHTCARVDDWDTFRREVDQQPYPVAFERSTGPNRLLYLDARTTLGHFVEYACMPQDFWIRSGGK
jgi:hypothetical protein